MGESIGTVLAHPILIAGIGITWVISSIIYMALTSIPFIGMFLALVAWIVPALALAATLAMAYEGVRGSPSFDHLMEGLEENWQRMIGAFVVLVMGYMTLMLTITVGIILLFLFGIVGADMSAGTGGGPAVLSALGVGFLLVMGLVALLVAVVGIAIQFFDAAIVVGDADVIGSFKTSMSVARSNPISIVGYTILRGLLVYVPVVLAVLAGVTGGIAGGVLLSEDLAVFGGFALAFVVFVVSAPVIWTVLSVYHVSYFTHASGLRNRGHL
ncbi:hypothetical protein AB7C87_00090 [Natrarchaeobius sp. A-rgal3]|uniref:DUF7847 domain-containing protein n=1 Tax=Natrarchaeobius versutus TaxID=1679078 RepID=UPI00350F1227